MGKRAKELAAGGAWVVAVILGVVPNIWPKALNSHHTLLILFILLGAAMAYASVSDKADASQSNSVGRDSFGPQLLAGRDATYIGDSAIRALTPGLQQAVTVAPVEERLAELELNPAKLTLFYSESDWFWEFEPEYFVEGLQKACVVWVKNRCPDEGQSGINTGPIFVHLEFYECVSGLPAADIDRAYWVRSSSNQVSLAPGTKFAVFLGFRKEDNWISYGNEYGHSASRDFYQAQREHRWLKDETKIPLKQGIEIQVSLIAAKSLKTLISRRILLRQDGEEYTVREVQ